MSGVQRGLAGGGSRLTELFRQAGRPLLMPYATGGYPDLEVSRAIVEAYLRAGADIVELGIPFSDPLADGPVIQATSTQALWAGTRPTDVLEIAAHAANGGAPVVLLSYLNTILAMGPERFFERAGSRGVLGVVVPDLPVDEAAEMQATARARDVDVILLAAPTSTERRLDRIAEAASGFIYCVSVAGVTGVRGSVRADLPAFVARLRSRTDLPLAVGFGVSTPEQAAEIAGLADGVIIGSRLMSLFDEGTSTQDSLERIERFLGEIARSMKRDSPD